MTKQEKTALNMARFIRNQTLTLLEKLNDLDADEQADICESQKSMTIRGNPGYSLINQPV
ncbi:Rop family plasmid primer RNA-binding protein [Salmonella enterica subsp. enterica serovar Typhimurium]|nr:Rop family plasmid primer RNA-binding protein [Salmonella enterica subsp. enterica serovar Typhimurium]